MSFNAKGKNSLPAASASDEDSDFSDNDEIDSESDTSEDSNGEELTPLMDAAILRTLGRIRRGDINDGENVFETEQQALLDAAAANGSSGLLKRQPSVKKQKPILLADYQRINLLAEASNSNNATASSSTEPRILTHAEEQEALRKETLSAFGNFEGDENDEEEDLFVKKDGDSGEGDEFKNYLLGNVGDEETIKEILGIGSSSNPSAPVLSDEGDDADDEVKDDDEDVEGVDGVKPKRKRTKRKKKELSEEDIKKQNDEFLLNYILNQGWIDSTSSAPALSSTTKSIKKRKRRDSDLSADEVDEDEFEDRADDFETAYNFRFEESGATNIPTHPRQITDVARRPDDARKLARAARKERKAAERAVQEEKLKAAKNKKKNEIERKLKELGLLSTKPSSHGGKQEMDLDDIGFDLGSDDEWDEGEYDKKMAMLLGEDGDEDQQFDENGKPVWDDIDGGNDWAEGEGYEVEGGEMDGMDEGEGMDMVMDEDDDDNIDMDADHLGEAPESSKKKKKSKKDKKKKKKDKTGGLEDESAQAMEEEPSEDANVVKFEGTKEEKKKKVDEIMEEYYQMDHEDMIGDMPTRFHYTQTPAQTYGLTPTEILLATDAELNTFLGIKQYAPYRADGGAGAGRVGRDKRLWELKKKLKGRMWGADPDEGGKKKYFSKDGGAGGGDGAGGKPKKRMGKKERERQKLVAATAIGHAASSGLSATAAESNIVERPSTGGDAPPTKKKKTKSATEA